jgi:hypothetical protein
MVGQSFEAETRFVPGSPDLTKEPAMIDPTLLAPFTSLANANDSAKEIACEFIRGVRARLGILPARATRRGGAYYAEPAPFCTMLWATAGRSAVNVAIAFKATPQELDDLPLKPVAYQRGVYSYLNIRRLEDVSIALVAAERAWENMQTQIAGV